MTVDHFVRAFFRLLSSTAYMAKSLDGVTYIIVTVHSCRMMHTPPNGGEDKCVNVLVNVVRPRWRTRMVAAPSIVICSFSCACVHVPCGWVGVLDGKVVVTTAILIGA
jgi:hypothetical protein